MANYPRCARNILCAERGRFCPRQSAAGGEEEPMNGDVRVRAATIDDIGGIMAVELKQFLEVGEGAAATLEEMVRRIELCNSGDLKWFLVAECLGQVVGYMVLMPTSMKPEECDSWAHATDNGRLTGMWDLNGDNMYVVSFAALSEAPECASVLLVYHSTRLWRDAGKKVYMFCARMPGFAQAHTQTGISPEEYWQRRGPDGLPEDWMLRLYTMMSGGQGPHRLLLNGYPPDKASGGHGVLYVVTSIELSQKGERRMLSPLQITEKMNESVIMDGRVQLSLGGGNRQVWDIIEKRMVDLSTIYVGYGCPDWGMCTFCSLPKAVEQYRQAFYGGCPIPDTDHTEVFTQSLQRIGRPHTVMVFNAGSFMAMPTPVQITMMKLARDTGFIRRVVVESRAILVKDDILSQLTGVLAPAGIGLTVRIGVETKDDYLRLKVLKKGHSRRALHKAVTAMKRHGVQSGGYVMFKPCPSMDSEAAMDEVMATFQFVLDELDMDEAYFGPTCVGPGTPLYEAWQQGDFTPPTLWETARVLQMGTAIYPAKIHLNQFADEPPFVAVPSNHLLRGVHQNLRGASGCDLEFHTLFDTYRKTMDPSVITQLPQCDCRPAWI